MSLLMPFLSARPAAYADISGDALHPSLKGRASFFAHESGCIVIVELWGLPHNSAPCAANIFAVHIHASGDCSPLSDSSPFSHAGGHFNPDNCPHPEHAGDMPPLFGNDGYAWQGFYTENFIPEDIVGRAIIIHSQRDDFTSQPAGDSGERIGCGVIKTTKAIWA